MNRKMAHFSTLMLIIHSPRTAYFAWINVLVRVQNRDLGKHLPIFHHFHHSTPRDWAFEVHIYAYAHNSQPISELNVSPNESVFHKTPRIPLNFDSSQTSTVIHLNFVFPNYALNFQNIHNMINEFKSILLQNSFQTYITMASCRRNCYVINIFHCI